MRHYASKLSPLIISAAVLWKQLIFPSLFNMDSEHKKHHFGPSALRLNPKQLVTLSVPPVRCLFIPLFVAKCWLSIWISYTTSSMVPLKHP